LSNSVRSFGFIGTVFQSRRNLTCEDGSNKSLAIINGPSSGTGG
jgi:hypothetical protein